MKLMKFVNENEVHEVISIQHFKMADSMALGTASLDFTKLKVPDLKRELKLRGLPTSGNKNELLERLQTSLKNNDHGTSESVEDLDEDLLNEDDELDATDSVINNIDAALNESPIIKVPHKRKLEENGQTQEHIPSKKVILNRNPIVNDRRSSEDSKNSLNGLNTVEESKKVVKLSEISAKERLEMRAKKFHTSLSTEAKKTVRAERFGLGQPVTSSGTVKIKNSNDDMKQKRAERFGLTASNTVSTENDQDRLEKRKQRFGTVSNTNTYKNLSPMEKKLQRLERFKKGK